MKKKIKDLTEQEKIKICCKYDMCFMCPLEINRNVCIRKVDISKLEERIGKDCFERYLNKEVVL